MKRIALFSLLFFPCLLSGNYNINHHDTLQGEKHEQRLDSAIRLYKLSHYRAAIDSLQKIYGEVINLRNDLASLSLRYIGNCYFFLNKTDSSLKYYKMYYEMIPVADSQTMITALNNIGVAYMKRDENITAREYFAKAMLLERILSKRGSFSYPLLYSNLGLLYLKERKYDSSYLFFYNAIDGLLKSSDNDSCKIINVLFSIAFGKRNEKKMTQSLNIALAALKAYERNKCTNIIHKSDLLEHIASCYFELGDFSGALDYYKQAYKMQKKILDDLPNDIFWGLGYSFLKLNEPDSAAFYYNKMLKASEKEPVLRRIVAYRRYGAYQFLLKKWDESIIYFLKSYNISAEKIGEINPQQMNILNNIGHNYLYLKKYANALIYLQKSLKCIDTSVSLDNFAINPEINSIELSSLIISSVRYKIVALHALSLVEEDAEKRMELLTSLVSNARYGLDVLNRILLTSSLITDKVDIINRDIDILVRNGISACSILHTEYHQDGYLFKGLLIAEMGKSLLARSRFEQEYYYQEHQGILDEMNHLNAVDDLNDGIGQGENTSYIQTILEADRIKPEVLDSAILQEITANQEIKLQKLLGHWSAKDYNLIEYQFLSDTVLLIFVNNSSGLRVETVKLDSLFQLSFNYLLDVLNHHPSGFRIAPTQYDTNANRVYSVLFQPLIRHLTGNKILISGDLYLTKLPFGMLTSKINAKANSFKMLNYLELHYQFTQIPSLFTLDTTYLHRANPCRLLGVAPVYEDLPDSVFGLCRHILPLPASINEMSFLNNLTDSRILINNKATVGNFIGNVADYQIVHLATHSCIDDENPMNSSLLFYPDVKSNETALSVKKLFEHKLDAAMVVLSGCETGRGEILKSEGQISIGWAFLYSGCKSIVVSSNWLNDETSVEIMKKYYTGLKEGLSKDAALNRAKREFLNNCTDFNSNPSFWASVVLIGNPSEIVLREPSNKIIQVLTWFVFVFIIAAMVFLIVKKKKSTRG